MFKKILSPPFNWTGVVLLSFALIGVCSYQYYTKEKPSIQIINDFNGNTKFTNNNIINVEKYNDTNIIYGKNGWKITGHANSGLKLLYELKKENKYELLIKGHSENGSNILRISDSEGYKYLAAPEGEEIKIVSDTSQLELLFYADEDYSYVLETISITECDQCKTDHDLKALIISEIPELQVLLVSDRLKAAIKLLDWSANTADYASSRVAISNRKISIKTAAEIYYNVFEPDMGGALCGGIAVYFDKILKLFDFNSFTIDFGHSKGDLTHVTVILGYREKGETIYYLLDPTFNMILIDKESRKLLSMKQILNRIKQGNFDSIDILGASLDNRDFLVDRNEIEKCKKIKSDTEKWLVCSYPGFGFGVYSEKWSNRYKENGYEDDLAGFLQILKNRVFSVGTSIDPYYSNHFFELLGDYGIPVGYP